MINHSVKLLLNGKTIRNEDGEVIYVDIHDGKAILENIPITTTWVELETTIQAIFKGNDEEEPIWTDKNIVTASKAKANLILLPQKLHDVEIQ